MRRPNIQVRAQNDSWDGALRRALAFLAAGALLAGCAGAQGGAPTEQAGAPAEQSSAAGQAGAEGAVAIDDILADPARFQGQQLTLSGHVSRALSNRAFRIEPGLPGLADPNTLDNGLLVIVADAADEPVDIDGQTAVMVTGELGTFDPNNLPPGIGAEFNPNASGIATGDPVLFAEQVMVEATIGRIDADPGAYLDNVVTVTGEVAEVLRDGIVRLEEPGLGGGELLVVVGDAAPEGTLEEGQSLTVTGMVRQFRLQELEGGLGFDLDDGIFAGWENRAVIMAESVRDS